ncbi:diacylglycerol/lipid kinase family protein [Nocardia seriolae]|uniref:Diacylglycerol kinase (ATP) n=1 Tax=Nocardia seriolae TaxID=37332 RepID=A0ABC8AQL9_9NOCA|nr:diacylglycerol kinase family protein [Nocardia seriolae]APA96446.1 Diacylglycerol kinase (ATP) [Nocardia seriolae]MTJ61513.1 hypothetical protein [Nocardia seriolae]MTJ71370.1 hypothetical protein [Nocardia seriolae]MTJ86542.1 hypothetical protein [Nocardia seriolae]MTK30537.1 hypothetical protein [Nocardia seriolae]
MTLASVPIPAVTGIESVDVIGNPCTAGGRGLRTAVTAAHHLAARGVRVRRLRGTTPETTIELVRRRLSRPDRPDAIVCAGGDELISLVLQAISATGVPLGILPTGQRDDLAAELGIPLGDPQAAADVVLAGNRREIDVGVVDTAPGSRVATGRTWFATVLYAGTDTRIADRTNRSWFPSRHTSLIELASGTARPFRIELSCGGNLSAPTVIETEALMVAVGNTRVCGGKLICPDARLDDGLLDVTVIGAVNRMEATCLLTMLAAGRAISHRAVAYYRAAVVSVHCPEVHAIVNGAPLSALPVTVRAVPAGQSILVP